MAFSPEEETALKAVAAQKKAKSDLDAAIAARDAAQQQCEADKQAAYLKDVKPLDDQVTILYQQLAALP